MLHGRRTSCPASSLNAGARNYLESLAVAAKRVFPQYLLNIGRVSPRARLGLILIFPSSSSTFCSRPLLRTYALEAARSYILYPLSHWNGGADNVRCHPCHQYLLFFERPCSHRQFPLHTTFEFLHHHKVFLSSFSPTQLRERLKKIHHYGVELRCL